MRKPDSAHRRTDQELADLESRIAAEYKKAAEELQEKIDAYFEKFKERDAEQLQKLKNGEITAEYYKQWRLVQIGRGKRFEALRDRVAERMTDANTVAAAYINDATPGLYSLNRNYAAYTIEQQVGADVGFDLWDEQTVRRLIVERPDLMPYYPPQRAINRGIDLAYGKRQITAQLTSGILQGESIKHLADRLQTNIPNMNRTSAIRAARTAVTGAQNAGRMDSYAAAEGMGIKLKKRWLSTLDNRTWHTHALLDGQVRPNDKPFEVSGYEIMFPGDPSAAPEMVYNCRCTLVAEVEGVDMSDALRRDRYGVLPNMTFAQWENTKRGEGALAAGRAEQKEAEREARGRKQFAEYKKLLGDDLALFLIVAIVLAFPR
jgi:SPP1 gp7 family putative phage head morphogenesis protein